MTIGDRYVPVDGDAKDEIEVISAIDPGGFVTLKVLSSGVTFTATQSILLDPLRWRLTSFMGPSGGTAHVFPPLPTQGVKWDQKKLRYDLIPPSFSRGLAEVLTYGAAKYSDDNWSKVPDLRRRYYAAMLRHVEAWRMGEAKDEESGLAHLDHAAACLAFLRADAAGERGTSLDQPGKIAP